MEIKLSKTLSKADELSFVTLPFELPADVESFTVAYSFDRTKTPKASGGKEQNCIDIALVDERGNQVGASGSARREFFVSERWSTPGYHAVPLTPGTWGVLLGLYMLKDAGATVDVTINITPKKLRWLKGDPHTHTFHSDGKLSVAGLAKKAKAMGLDWLFITDHNVHHAEDMLCSDKDFLMLKGTELTGYVGHLNMLGADKPFDLPYSFSTKEELGALLASARERGAVISVNHPSCKKCGWHLPLDFDFECMEVWNGPMRVDNMAAIDLWHSFLLAGRRIAAVGGSDFHQDYVVTKLLGNPTTVVWAASNTKDDIIAALTGGHAYVTNKPNGVALTIFEGKDGAGTGMGDSAKWSDKSTVRVSASMLKKGESLIVYNNDEILLNETATKSAPVTRDIRVPQKGFVRAEIQHTYGKLMTAGYHLVMRFMLPQDKHVAMRPFAKALTNPIFFE